MNEVKNKSNLYYELMLAPAIKENSLFILPVNFNISPFIQLLNSYREINFPKKKLLLILDEKISNNELYTSLVKIGLKEIVSTCVNELSPVKRSEYYKKPIIITTAQQLYNDFLRQLIDPKEICQFVFLQAHKVRGKQSSVKILELYEKLGVNIRIVAISSYNFQTKDELIDVLNTMKITHIDFGRSTDSLVTNHLHTHRRNKEIIPLNSEINDFCLYLRQKIMDYCEYLEKHGIKNTKKARQNIKLTFSYIDTSQVNSEQKSIMKQYLIILILLQNIHDGLESTGPLLPLKMVDNWLTKEKNDLNFFDIEDHTIEIVKSIRKELEWLEKNIVPNKEKRLIEYIRKKIEDDDKCRLIVITDTKIVAEHLVDILKEAEINSTLLPTKKNLKREKIISLVESGTLHVLISTKPLSLTVSSYVYYNSPAKYDVFIEQSDKKDTVVFLTHNSHEERVFYKFINQEKQTFTFVNDDDIKLTLAKNQNRQFKKKQYDNLDSRTKTMLTLVRKFSDNKKT